MDLPSILENKAERPIIEIVYAWVNLLAIVTIGRLEGPIFNNGPLEC